MAVNNTILARCTAGFGSRIIILIGGIYLAKALNYNLVIIWPRTEICDCDFFDIFEKDNCAFSDKLHTTQDYYMQLKTNNVFDIKISHEDFSSKDREKYKCITRDVRTIDDISTLTRYRCILYQSNNLPPSLSLSDTIDILSLFKIKKNILTTVLDFVHNNKITYRDKGYHVRLADRPIFSDTEKIKSAEKIKSEILADKDNRYFVCSGEKEFEDIISNFSNVVVRHKVNMPLFITSYEQLFNNPKRERIIACNTEAKYPFNYVDTEGVIDAFVDLLILSRTNIIPQQNVMSNFRDLASLYSHVFFTKKFLKYNEKIIKI
jgi:hypothetical protein